MTWFGGVSRFQFSYTDCLECNGVGFLDLPPNDTLEPQDISNGTVLSTEQADQFLKVLAKVLSQAMVDNEDIRLRGFGSFSCPASTNTNSRKILFSPSARLHQELNQD